MARLRPSGCNGPVKPYSCDSRALGGWFIKQPACLHITSTWRLAEITAGGPATQFLQGAKLCAAGKLYVADGICAAQSVEKVLVRVGLLPVRVVVLRKHRLVVW